MKLRKGLIALSLVSLGLPLFSCETSSSFNKIDPTDFLFEVKNLEENIYQDASISYSKKVSVSNSQTSNVKATREAKLVDDVYLILDSSDDYAERLLNLTLLEFAFSVYTYSSYSFYVNASFYQVTYLDPISKNNSSYTFNKFGRLVSFKSSEDNQVAEISYSNPVEKEKAVDKEFEELPEADYFPLLSRTYQMISKKVFYENSKRDYLLFSRSYATTTLASGKKINSFFIYDETDYEYKSSDGTPNDFLSPLNEMAHTRATSLASNVRTIVRNYFVGKDSNKEDIFGFEIATNKKLAMYLYSLSYKHLVAIKEFDLTNGEITESRFNYESARSRDKLIPTPVGETTYDIAYKYFDNKQSFFKYFNSATASVYEYFPLKEKTNYETLNYYCVSKSYFPKTEKDNNDEVTTLINSDPLYVFNHHYQTNIVSIYFSDYKCSIIVNEAGFYNYVFSIHGYLLSASIKTETYECKVTFAYGEECK